jgi:hypothetical protein
MATQKKEPPKDESELYPDAWDRFRQAVHVMAKAGPQHRIGAVVKHKIIPKSKARPTSKGRVHKGKTRV